MDYHVVVLHYDGETDVNMIQAETAQNALGLALNEYRKTNNLPLEVRIESKVVYSHSDPGMATGYFTGFNYELAKSLKGASNG